MNSAVKELFERQERERMDFCEFSKTPANPETAILELVERFTNISHGQVVNLLELWFPKFIIAPLIETLVFDKRLCRDLHLTRLSLPKS